MGFLVSVASALLRRLLLLRLVLVLGLLVGRSIELRLHPGDVAALEGLRAGLGDLPGSSFFQSWGQNVITGNGDACTVFAGVQCGYFQGQQRVISLRLGQQTGNSPGLHGKLSPSIGHLTALVELTLVPGRVTGPIPASLSQLSNLKLLALSRNFLTGQLPPTLPALKRLTTLDLGYNRLQGSIPHGLATLPALTVLVLAKNHFTGSLPVFHAPLLHLDVKQNGLQGSLPGLPPTLRHLSLSRNQLSGSLLAMESAGIPDLQFLDLSFNRFSGEIPAALFAIPSLESLLLQRNQFSGGLHPPTLVSMATVDLSYNRIGGTVPPHLAFVRNLYLNNNELRGWVPEDFVGRLMSGSMQTLFLQHNYISGFPLTAWASLPPSAYVCIQFNCMNPPSKTAGFSCPLQSGRRFSRPPSQCRNIHPGKR